ncbi:Autophagy protein 5, partial [Glycine soja]
VHFRGYPSNILLPFEAEDSVKWSFINSLKEVNYVISSLCVHVFMMVMVVCWTEGKLMDQVSVMFVCYKMSFNNKTRTHCCFQIRSSQMESMLLYWCGSSLKNGMHK